MGYREENLIKVPLKPSPSLVYNNLCAVGPGVAFAHTRQVAVLANLPTSTASTAEAKRVDTQDHSTVQTVTSCNVSNTTLIVLGNEAGIQVWDDTGSNLLYVWKLPATDNPAAKCADFVRGISFNVSADGDVQLCAGCSSGAIQVFSIAAGPSIKPSATLQHHKTPIVALGSAYQSRRGAWSEDLTCELVSCDDQGTLAVWTADNASCYSCSHTIPGTGVPGCSVAVRKGFILCGKTDGTVQVYGLKDGRPRCEVVAHSRWLTAMDMHPSKDIFATVAEDCTLNVWTIPVEGQQVSNLFSVCCLHAALTGVAFCGKSNDDIAAVAYDTDEISIWKSD
eukprot:jgi/Chrzof1/3931/Cz13g13240.t1